MLIHESDFDEVAQAEFGAFPDLALPLVELDSVLLRYWHSEDRGRLPVDRIFNDMILARVRFRRGNSFFLLLATVRKTDSGLVKKKFSVVAIPLSKVA